MWAPRYVDCKNYTPVSSLLFAKHHSSIDESETEPLWFILMLLNPHPSNACEPMT